MKKYTKAIAAFVGAGVTALAAFNMLPEGVNAEEATATITTAVTLVIALGAAVVTAVSPKNKE